MFSKWDLFFTPICNITSLCFIMSGKMSGIRPKMSKHHFQNRSAPSQKFFLLQSVETVPFALAVLNVMEIHLCYHFCGQAAFLRYLLPSALP